MRKQSVAKFVALAFAFALPLTLCLPWFYIPLLTWSFPLPAWNRAGVICLVVSMTLFARFLGGAKFRWPLRVFTSMALFFWWGSLASVKAWGASHLGAAQLGLSKFNMALATLGAETVSLYNASKWKQLSPAIGWYLTGALLISTLLFSLWDKQALKTCPGLSLIHI